MTNLERPCGWCGSATTSPRAVCRRCIPDEIRARHRHRTPSPSHALSGGRWVGVRGVQAWEPDGEFA